LATLESLERATREHTCKEQQCPYRSRVDQRYDQLFLEVHWVRPSGSIDAYMLMFRTSFPRV